MCGNPRIYNGDGIYNGGGGSGTFDVDLGGGVSQTLVFPPYLIPVKYIDLSNTAGNISILGARKFECKDNYSAKTVFSLKSSNMSTVNYIFNCQPPLGHNGTAAFKFSVEKGSSHISWRYFFSGLLHTNTADNLNWDTDIITASYVAAQKKVTLIDEHGFTSSNSSSSPSMNPIGSWTIAGDNFVSNVNTMRGKFYYSWLRDDLTNKLIALWVPARDKNNTNIPYIVDCVGGAVGLNYAVGTVSGTEFGEDIDLSSDVNAWIT